MIWGLNLIRVRNGFYVLGLGSEEVFFLIWIRGKLSWDWIGAFTLDIQEGAGFSPGQGPRNN